ncbi:acetate--CoA ligase family protein [Arthrobacter sp. VKM Ac-2550]|uniref:acetate--CoA ligase family protein n=1 Tax=Crystallibacter permensis TaxID=1938888 RepID=UPI00222761D9|nr:acetate--CoA ligase family protein [Arthrobacter sp. VKM Ac-2550]MCW2135243.1 acetyltransferase [Arthrobacter sp. VKM Ac-2550]
MADLTPLFAPSGVVVVGASATPGKLGAVMADSLGAYGPNLHLVNSRGGDGLHTSIAAAVAAADSPLDLAVLCVPAAATAQALRDSAAQGIQAALVCSGGFAEAGGPGLEYDRQVRQAVAEAGIRLLGPNTSGFFVPRSSLRASFVPGVAQLSPGPVAVVAASGGINHVLAFHLERAGVGVSLGVGIGAGLDITAPEVLDYLADDEATRVVALHLETVADGPLLLDAVRRLSSRKPVVALVVGRNDVSEFAQSHTGALATSWNTTRAVLRQAGAVVVDDEIQLVDAATALSGRRARPAAAAEAGLVTGQAGPGLLIADYLHSSGVGLPRLQEAALRRISEVLPPLTFQANPVDTGRPGPGYETVLSAVADDEGIDLVGVYGITEPVISLPDAVAASGILADVPVLVGVDGPEAEVRQAQEAAARAGVPLLVGPTSLARGLAALAADAQAQHLRQEDGDHPSAGALVDTAGPWDESRAKNLLQGLGFSTPPRRSCSTRDEARAAFAEIGAPVAVKLLDAEVLHKTEIGGVHLGVSTESELEAALDALERIGAKQFLVERMADKGVDLVLGVRRDPVFGPIAVLGLGGIATEVFADSTIRSLPVSRRSARAMPDELISAKLLHGFRGGPALDADVLAEHIRVLGATLTANPDITDIEINPLRLTENGLVALDAVVITTEEN